MFDDADIYFHNLRNTRAAADKAKKDREELEAQIQFVSYEAAVWPELYGPSGSETLKRKEANKNEK